jgi:carboxyl-terminal processing protease
MKSLVLDLRNNPGGLLDAAVAVAEPFFKKGELIVYTQGRRPKDRDEYRAEADDTPINVPTVVLINSGSASAAEIIAGALKDTGRAVIVGERSFGKGSVQSIFRLDNGEGMRLTTARYYTPSGVTLHERGVEPTVEIVMSPDEDQNIRLQRTRRDVTDPAEFKERFGIDPVADRQLQAALDILTSMRLLAERDGTGTQTPRTAAVR